VTLSVEGLSALAGIVGPGRMPMMETVGRKKPGRRRSFTPGFNADIVERCHRGDRSIGEVARDFDLTETAVREWVKRAQVDAGERAGLSSARRCLASAGARAVCCVPVPRCPRTVERT
jgi:transposase-like protein